MTAQKYSIIADRARGDIIGPAGDGDRVTYGRNGWGQVVAVRIERPVPTTDEQWDKIDDLTREWRQAIITDDEYSNAVRALLPSPHPPTREQIAEAQDVVRSLRARAASREAAHMTLPDPAARGAFARDARLMREAADAFDAVLALIRNGADR